MINETATRYDIAKKVVQYERGSVLRILPLTVLL